MNSIGKRQCGIDGLDRIHKYRGINRCIDLSATPYYLGRVGQDANRPFPWVVSDFGLIDAIESGLVKIPQLAVRDTSGNAVPGYFNIWRWILPKLTPAERGGRHGKVKPAAILKYAHVPLAMLGGLWEDLRAEWERRKDEGRPPRLHYRLQGHRARQGRLPMARRGHDAGGDSAIALGRTAKLQRECPTRFARTPRSSVNPTAGIQNQTKIDGCVSLSIPSVRSIGRGTDKGEPSILRGLKPWPRSWNTRCTLPAGM